MPQLWLTLSNFKLRGLTKACRADLGQPRSWRVTRQVSPSGGRRAGVVVHRAPQPRYPGEAGRCLNGGWYEYRRSPSRRPARRFAGGLGASASYRRATSPRVGRADRMEHGRDPSHEACPRETRAIPRGRHRRGVTGGRLETDRPGWRRMFVVRGDLGGTIVQD
jgi:hypothetical protein